ncbi:hypothetical protein HY605_00410 [Candidatus Peregrinibacteria bacterium]|nr:hypothetical protein [Candidatus Peregrinibacteria bacterium]
MSERISYSEPSSPDQYTDVVEIHRLEEINGQGATQLGLLKGLQADIAALPLLVRSLLRSRIDRTQEKSRPEKPTDILTIPGLAAGNWHLSALRAELQGSGDHYLFDTAIRNRSVMEDARLLAEDIVDQQTAVSFLAHSRGGLVLLCMLRILEESGYDDLVRSMTLLSPTSHGIRPEMAKFARLIPLQAIQDLCPGSEPVKFWQELGPRPRSRITVVSQAGGDLFTSPERSFVEGSRMLVTPHCGHQEGVLDPKTPFFQTALRSARTS